MEEKERSYLLGIIGALIGGLIGTIPWILFYVYANMIYSLLALVVALCSLKGYELFKGKIDNKLPYIIAITSFLSITIATLIIIPNLLIIKELGITSIANFKLLYSTSEFTMALLGNYVISLLFTFLGIGGVISSIKRQVNIGNNKIDLNYNDNNISDEEKEKIKNIFVKYNALDKNNTISKEILMRELDDEEKINYLVSKGLLKVKKGNYYYSEKAEKINYKKRNIIITICCILIVFGIGIITNLDSDDSNKNEITDNRVANYIIPDDYQEYENDEGGWYYLPKKDLSGYSGVIEVSFDVSEYAFEDFATIKNNMKNSFEEENYTITSIDEYINDKGNHVLVYILDFNDYEELIYYVFKENNYAIIDGFDYKNVKNSTIKDTIIEIVKEFDWK